MVLGFSRSNFYVIERWSSCEDKPRTPRLSKARFIRLISFRFPEVFFVFKIFWAVSIYILIGFYFLAKIIYYSEAFSSSSCLF
jgi:hypothetical protein